MLILGPTRELCSQHNILLHNFGVLNLTDRRTVLLAALLLDLEATADCRTV